MTAAQLQESLARFLDALAARLESARDAADRPSIATAIGGFMSLLMRVDRHGGPAVAPKGGGDRLPVGRHWEAALALGTGHARDLAHALRPLRESLGWTQTAGYVRRPPAPSFLKSYGYAVIAGPPHGSPGLVVSPDLALGVLLLGPDTHYPLHRHPAAEIYCPIGGDAEWWMGEGPWRRESAGAVIYHAPHVPHATRTGPAPLLAIYLWRGDLATEARFVFDRG